MKVWNTTLALFLGAILCSTFLTQHVQARGLLGAMIKEVEEAQQHESINREEGVFAVDEKEEESFHAGGPRRRLAHTAVERDLWWRTVHHSSSSSGKVRLYRVEFVNASQFASTIITSHSPFHLILRRDLEKWV